MTWRRGHGLCVVLVLAVAAIVGCGGGDGGVAPGPPTNVIIGPAGGTVTHAGGKVTLDFPANAVAVATPITLDYQDTYPASTEFVANTCYSFEPTGTQFLQPVQTTIKYSAADIPAGVDEATLGIYKVVGAGWEAVADSAVDTVDKTVTAAINSFSSYAVLGLSGHGERYTWVSRWGTQGNGDGQFGMIGGLGWAGNEVYVSDTDLGTPTQRIQVFNAGGTFQRSYVGWTASAMPVEGMAVHATGTMYAALLDRLEVLDANGQALHTVTKGSFTPPLVEFVPWDVAFDSARNIYVVECDRMQIFKFDADAEYVTAWGAAGYGDGEFQVIGGLAAGPDDSIYATDVLNNRVQKFTADGTFLGWWGKDPAGNNGWHGPGTPTGPASSGSRDGDFFQPWGVDVDGAGAVYVCDGLNHRVQKFTANGDFITKFGDAPGTSNAELDMPHDVVVSPDGVTVYVGDEGEFRVQVFQRAQ